MADRVGAVFGPHLPHESTSPMIARELTEFFAGFAPNGRPVAQRLGDAAFLSNVNACYLRECWDSIRFDDVAYAEDQAFGRRDARAGLDQGLPPARRGLPRARLRPGGVHAPLLRRVPGAARNDRPRGADLGARPGWNGPPPAVGRPGLDARARLRRPRPCRLGVRSAAHHTGRGVASALGSRAERLPGPLQHAFSLERRAGARPPAHVAPGRDKPLWESVARLERDGPAPLLTAGPQAAERERLHIALVIPPFGRGSGGHNSIFQMTLRLERMDTRARCGCSIPREQTGACPGELRRRVVEDFAPIAAPVFKGFGDWYGADVAVATGWETAYPVMLLPGCKARAYLIHDHESEFFATSAEALWAERTYSFDLYPINGGRLADATCSHKRYGRRELVPLRGRPRRLPARARGRPPARHRAVLLPRGHTSAGGAARAARAGRAVAAPPGPARRAVRRPGPAWTTFPYEHLGVASPETLARRYAEATVGVSLSLTNYSLIPQEMMACGLPCVDLAGRSSEGGFRARRPGGAGRPEPDRPGERDRADARRRAGLGKALGGRPGVRRGRNLGRGRAAGGAGTASSARGASVEPTSARASSSGTPISTRPVSNQNTHGPTQPGRNTLARSKTSGSVASIERGSSFRKTTATSVASSRSPRSARALGSDAIAVLP